MNESVTISTGRHRQNYPSDNQSITHFQHISAFWFIVSIILEYYVSTQQFASLKTLPKFKI